MDLPDPDPSLIFFYRSGNFHHRVKGVRKLPPTDFLLFDDFLSLKNDVNVPSKTAVISEKSKEKKYFWKVTDE